MPVGPQAGDHAIGDSVDAPLVEHAGA